MREMLSESNNETTTKATAISSENKVVQEISGNQTPWRSRNIYSYINVKKTSVERLIAIGIVIIALLVIWFATTTKGLPVSFETYGGTSIESVRYMFDEKISRPEDPKREGYAFEDWYPNAALIAPWDFDNDRVQGEMTLHAKWEKINK